MNWAVGGKGIGATHRECQTFVGGGVSDTGNGTFANTTVFDLQGLAQDIIPYGAVAGRVLDGRGER